MTYTPHTWVEYAGTGTQKATWLNNAETQYDEIVDYCDNTLHATQYYDKTDTDAKFFGAANQGSGSGFVLEYLDGYTGDQLLEAGVAPYFICIWNGSVAGIPSGWHLCDGRNSYTPDLRGRFIVGAGASYTVGATGGAATVTSSGTVTVGSHSLTTSEIPNHSHTIPHDSWSPYNASASGGPGALAGGAESPTDNANTTSTAGTGTGHTHTGSTIKGLGTAGNNMPAYYALAYIIKEP